MLNQSICSVCRSKRVTRQNTQVTRVGGGGQSCRGICLCAWGAKYRQAFCLILDLLIGWQMNGMWGYLLFERLQGVQTAWMNTFYIYFVFGIITISTTRVDFVCLG